MHVQAEHRDESNPLNLLSAVRWIMDTIRYRWKAIAKYSLGFQLLNYVLLAPLSAGLLSWLLNTWGRASVGNFEVASFLLSPIGLTAIIIVGALRVATLYFESAGIMRLMSDPSVAWWQALASHVSFVRRLLFLGIRQLAIALAITLPFVAGVLATHQLLWSKRDINSLIILKPPVFWQGVAIAALLVISLASILIWLQLRWIFALPNILFTENATPKSAIAASFRATHGKLRILLAAFAFWAVCQMILTTVFLVSLDFVSDLLLDRVDDSLEWAIIKVGFVLFLHSLVAIGLSMVGTTTLVGWVLYLYQHLDKSPHMLLPKHDQSVPSRISAPTLIGVVLPVLLAASTASGIAMLDQSSLNDHVEFTAHRAGAIHGPENTIFALRRAAEDQAEWAEIDVQRTLDDKLVVLHDTDLARIGGGSQQVRKATLEEIRQLDAGKILGSKFSGERVPTFEELLATAKETGIKLTVELKPSGKSDETALTTMVVAAIQKAQMLDQCRICSQSYESLMLSKKLEPSMAVGWIAANAMGDLTKLNVDFLMVRSSMATRDLVNRGKLANMEIHAWTINNPAQLVGLVDNGVQNVITDDIPLMREQLKAIQELSTTERIMLRLRTALKD